MQQTAHFLSYHEQVLPPNLTAFRRTLSFLTSVRTTSKNEFASKACYCCSPQVISAFNLAVLQGGHFHRKCNRNGLRWSSATFTQKERGWYRAIRTVALSLWCHFAPHVQCTHAMSLVAMCQSYSGSPCLSRNYKSTSTTVYICNTYVYGRST